MLGFLSIIVDLTGIRDFVGFDLATAIGWNSDDLIIGSSTVTGAGEMGVKTSVVSERNSDPLAPGKVLLIV